MVTVTALPKYTIRYNTDLIFIYGGYTLIAQKEGFIMHTYTVEYTFPHDYKVIKHLKFTFDTNVQCDCTSLLFNISHR